MKSIGRNPQLDGLRALAILLVLAAHWLRFRPGKLDSARDIIGEIGVSIFFVLSGFLITTLLLQERTRSGKIDLRAFYARRFRRIFPAYYAFLAVIALLAATGFVAIGWQELLADALYLRDYSIHSSSWLEHTWSLAVETQFYLIWPAVLLFFGKTRARNIAVACVALDPFVRVATYFLIPSQRDLLSIAFHTRVDMLMIGCATAIVVENGVPAVLQRALSAVKPPLCLGILAVCIAAAAFLRGTFQFSIGETIEGAAIVLMLLGVLEHPQSLIARVLVSNPMTWIGRISYSLYLWQQPFLFPIGHSFVARFPVDFIALFGAACLSYYFVERPFFKPKPVAVPVLSAKPDPA